MSYQPGGPARHRTRPASSRLTTRGKVLAAAAVASVVIIAISVATHRGKPAAHSSSPPVLGSSTPSSTTTSSSRAASSTVQLDGDQKQAQAELAALIAAAPAGGVSVAVRDMTTGRQYTAGATSGMTLASAAKVEILETMLLQQGGPLTGELDDLATDMIEHSSNDAADACFARLGGTDAYAAALPKLGLDPRVTGTDQGVYWGLNHTSAPQQLILLRNLFDDSSPLPKAARDYALKLMRQVEDDQRWGVPSIADAGTTAANKNGWLNIDSDDGLWAVNSDGIVTVHGHVLAMAVLTQHNKDFESGTARVNAIVAKLAATVLS